MFSNYTYLNLKDDLTGLVGGTDLAKIQNIEQAVRRAAQRVNARLDLKPTSRKYLLTLYEGVYDYAVPSDDDFKKAIDLRPQVSRNLTDNFHESFSERFDLRKKIDDALLSTDWRDGTQFFRISRNVASKTVVLDSMDAVGSWTAFGDASTPTADTVNKAQGSASLNFDLSGAGTNGGISNASLTSKDLTDHDEISSIFLWVYFPSASAITSVGLRWGNSATVYWERVVTAPHFGSFVTGWNLLRFDWNGATETGTVDPAAIDYLRVNIIYDGNADTDFRVDQIESKIGVIYELWYYSRFMFRSSAGTWKDTIAADADIINIDHDARNILVYECEDEIGKQLRDDDMIDEAKLELHGGAKNGKLITGLYEKYATSYPSEALRKRSTYYRV